jgi:transcriptional regulator with XRE-family HTH domain
MRSRKPSPEDIEKGRDILEWRKARGMNQATVGHLIDRAASQISKYELGKNRISAADYATLRRELAPEPSRQGFAEDQTGYRGPASRREEELQFLNWMIRVLERRRAELGGD